MENKVDNNERQIPSFVQQAPLIEDEDAREKMGMARSTADEKEGAAAATERVQDGSESEDEISSDDESRGLKVLFLSSDTGGGHRASAESLGKQFQLLFPGTTYDLLDVVEKDGVPPYNSLVSSYKHLSAHPSQWRLVYTVSNSRAFEMLADAHLKLMCERAVRRRIKSYDPDVVVSVHPLMTNVPVLSCSKISKETGRHLPIFTVVTDLGSAHCLWFDAGVEKMFVGSEKVKQLAKVRGKVPESKLVQAGLPIRHDFAVQAENMGDRMSPEGKAYQRKVREDLELPCTDRKTILVMGGGEGVGSLSNIVDALYVELVSEGIDALILVVCGRNEKLLNKLQERDWAKVMKRWKGIKERKGGLTRNFVSMALGRTCEGLPQVTGCIETGVVTGPIRRMLSSSSLTVGNVLSTPAQAAALFKEKENEINFSEEKKDTMEDGPNSPEDFMFEGIDTSESGSIGQFDVGESLSAEICNVEVVGLGFISRMAEYMVAADVLVSKAGPGTISEAAAVSLPVVLTSFLPGQEEGNVDYVVEGGFGSFRHEADPIGIAEEVCAWMLDEEKLASLSRKAKECGAPNAARDIAKSIGESTLRWKRLNEAKDAVESSSSSTSSVDESLSEKG